MNWRAPLLLGLLVGLPACSGDQGSAQGEAGAGGTAGTAGPGAGGAVGGGPVGGAPAGGTAAGGVGGNPNGCGPINSAALCNQPPAGELPPGPPAYSGGQCPALVPAPQRTAVTSSGRNRAMYVVVPSNPCPGETFPIVFMWHWISGEAKDVLFGGQLQTIADQQRFIAVIPEATGAEVFGQNTTWPFDVTQTQARMDEEFRVFDDMLSCVSAQYPTNFSCVGTIGVSAGALFASQLMQGRGQYLSSAIVLSGGVGAGTVRPWTGSPHKMPALVLWGGPADALPDAANPLFSFDTLSRELETGLTNSGHFLTECIHNCGHIPPLLQSGPNGESGLAPLYEFFMNHPYWLPDGGSPYAGGLPPTFPPWCGIGMNSAPPANIQNCPGGF